MFDWGVVSNDSGLTGKIDDDGIERCANFKPNNYMYKLIETMLPKAMVDSAKKHIRLLEM